MNKKKIIIILISYIFAFIASVFVSSLILNQGKVSAQLQGSDATLPVVYVRSGGHLINEMHGYLEEIDFGYFRETMTPVGESKTINLLVREYERDIVSAEYQLYNDQNIVCLEKGDCVDSQHTDEGYQTQIVFTNNLKSNREYCLKIVLTDSEGEKIYYSTRIRYGSNLQVAEKLQFILDFNEATFEKKHISDLSVFLETKQYHSSSNYNYVDIYSSADMVTWGNLDPYRTSEVAICLKEITTETAAFTLNYEIESDVNDQVTLYNVEEYYRIRLTEERTYLLDFERRMEEVLDTSMIKLEKGKIRLGIGDREAINCSLYGTEEQPFAYFMANHQLWHYDLSTHIITSVFSKQDTNHKCADLDEKDMKVVYADDETGDLYFLTYGYIHSGDFEGQTGIVVYRFRHEDVLLEELLFIPYQKGYAQLEESIHQLSYMNDAGELFLRIDDTIYRMNVHLGRMEVMYESVSSKKCAASVDGKLIMTKSGNSFAGSELMLVDLNTGKEELIREKGKLLVPYGFTDTDLVYGILDQSMISQDSSGVMQAPVEKLYVMNSEGDIVKSYENSGNYIMDVEIKTESLDITLARSVQKDKYTDYENVGEEHIIRNIQATESDFIEIQKDNYRGSENWINLQSTKSLTPVSQTARLIDPGYDITKEYTASENTDVVYYVYTKGHIDAVFDTLSEAIAYGNEHAGTVMTSHKQIVWQRAGRAVIWDLGITEIDEVKASNELSRVLLEKIVAFEEWDIQLSFDEKQSLFNVMSDQLPAEAVDLSGLDLTDILHFVYRDRVVIAKTGVDQYCLIVAFDNGYIKLADPQKGSVYWLSWNAAEALFSEGGNIFYSYLD